MESLMATVAQATKEAKRRIRAFLPLDRKGETKLHERQAQHVGRPKAAARIRRANLVGNPAVSIDRRDDGTIYLSRRRSLATSGRITDSPASLGKDRANRIFMAEACRGGLAADQLRALLTSSRRIASAAGARAVVGKPSSFLSGNRFDHAVIAFRRAHRHSVLSGIAGLSLVSRDTASSVFDEAA